MQWLRDFPMGFRWTFEHFDQRFGRLIDEQTLIDFVSLVESEFSLLYKLPFPPLTDPSWQHRTFLQSIFIYQPITKLSTYTLLQKQFHISINNWLLLVQTVYNHQCDKWRREKPRRKLQNIVVTWQQSITAKMLHQLVYQLCLPMEHLGQTTMNINITTLYFTLTLNKLDGLW